MPTVINLQKAELDSDCYVFKHSTRCPVSFAAADEVRVMNLDRPLYWINVVEQRPLSNWISEHYGVKHESPQLLRIRNNKVEAVWNHGEIKRDTVK